MTSLLDRFFAPISKGSAGSGAPGGAHAGVDDRRLDYSILPPFDDDDGTDATPGADAWDTVFVAEIPLPPLGTGSASIVVPPKIKVDKKKSVGAVKPKTTTTGGEAIEGTITVRFCQEALPAMVAAAKTLYPGSGPFPVRHPKATMGKLENIQVTAWTDAPTPDAWGEFTWVIHYREISASAQMGKGGSAVKTPKDVKTFIQPGDTDGDGHLLNERGDIIPGGSGEASVAAIKEAAKAGAAP